VLAALASKSLSDPTDRNALLGLPITYERNRLITHVRQTHSHDIGSLLDMDMASSQTVFRIDTIASISTSLNVSLIPTRSALHARIAALHAAAQSDHCAAAAQASGSHTVDVVVQGSTGGGTLRAPQSDPLSPLALSAHDASALSPFARKQLTRLAKSKSGTTNLRYVSSNLFNIFSFELNIPVYAHWHDNSGINNKVYVLHDCEHHRSK
jgi:hypothetical protein